MVKVVGSIDFRLLHFPIYRRLLYTPFIPIRTLSIVKVPNRGSRAHRLGLLCFGEIWSSFITQRNSYTCFRPSKRVHTAFLYCGALFFAPFQLQVDCIEAICVEKVRAVPLCAHFITNRDPSAGRVCSRFNFYYHLEEANVAIYLLHCRINLRRFNIPKGVGFDFTDATRTAKPRQMTEVRGALGKDACVAAKEKKSYTLLRDDFTMSGPCYSTYNLIRQSSQDEDESNVLIEQKG